MTRLTFLAPALLSSAIAVTSVTTARAVPPENLPPVSVTWEDVAQHDVFVVRGARYTARVGTAPARIVSLAVDGVDVLGNGTRGGFDFAANDDTGRRFVVVPADLTPEWSVWRGQSYRPAASAAARMNVWSATPYYTDAHLLDVPLMTKEGIDALRRQSAGEDEPVLKAWTFANGGAGWTAGHAAKVSQDGDALRVAITGDDPQLVSADTLDIQLPATIRIKLRTANSGSAAVYYVTDADHTFGADRHVAANLADAKDGGELKFVIPGTGRLRQLRFDPPGGKGDVRIDSIQAQRFTPPSADAIPLRGELVLHAHPDRLNIEFKVATSATTRPTTQPAPEPATQPGADAPKITRVELVASANARSMKVGDRAVAIFGAGANAAALLAPPRGAVELGQATRMFAPAIPLGASAVGNAWVFRPAAIDADLVSTFASELRPLAPTQLQATLGRWLGYDAASGLYVAEMTRDGGAFDFEDAHRVPNRRLELPIDIENDATARSITVKVRTGCCTLPGSMIADAHGFPTGIAGFVSKNFAGEHEEPDDTAYGDIYFPLTLAPKEKRSLDVIGLFERAGDHLVKQVSSVRFFNIYWHLSGGMSESTCFTQAWLHLNDAYVRIPDFRPRSGDGWVGQPQHNSDTWPGFLQYRSGGDDVRLMYERTIFRSIAPSLADFTMKFHTSDDAATASLRVMEIPQDDEVRTFATVRYDWTKKTAIDADARANFRWLNMSEKSMPTTLVWLDEDAKPQLTAIEQNEPTVLGQPLAKDGAFIGTAGKANLCDSIVLIRSFKAQLGGKTYNAASASAAFGKTRGEYWLGSQEASLTLQPGDFIEAELMLMPHAAPTPPLAKPVAERERWFVKPPAVSDVTIGTKASDFPATIEAEADAARFTISGGHDALPVIVGNVHGLAGRAPLPLLWRDDVWVDPQSHGGDGWQTDADSPTGDEADKNGTFRFTFVVPQRSGQRQHLSVTRVTSSEPIARLDDANARPRITAERESDFDLAAPILFGPGVNRVFAGQPLVAFKGHATAVSGLPIRANVATGEAILTVSEFGTDRLALSKAGEATTLTISELSTAVAYELRVNGVGSTPTVVGDAIEVKLPAGEATVELRRTVPSPP